MLRAYVDSSDAETLPSLYLSPQIEAMLWDPVEQWRDDAGLFVSAPGRSRPRPGRERAAVEFEKLVRDAPRRRPRAV